MDFRYCSVFYSKAGSLLLASILQDLMRTELIHWIYDVIEETLKDCCNIFPD
jgi:hypothetical protein